MRFVAGVRAAAAFIGKDHLTQVCNHVTHFPKIPPKPYDVILTGVNLSHLSFHYDVIGILSESRNLSGILSELRFPSGIFLIHVFHLKLRIPM